MNWTERDLEAWRQRHEVRVTPDPVPVRTRKGGRRADLNNRFFRSSWEANVARYLNWLIHIKAVSKWEYEPETFEFATIKRGSRFYTPDFKIWFARDSGPTYWEVKGWMDPKSRTKLNRMARHFPNVKVVVIGDKEYRNLKDQCKGSIMNWE